MRIFSEEVLKSNFPFNGTHLIEASAGTGKTYSIQNIYARLILERGLRVSEIQVMTFTEAATKELRERLRTILADVQAQLDDKGCPGKDDKERKQRNERADNLIQAGENISRERQKGFIGLALLEFDNAAISTIHGFCTRALAHYAFETRMPFLQQIDDNKSADLCRRTLDWWRKRQESTPVELLPGLDLQCLQDYVKALADKTAWDLADADESTPQGFMLLRAREIVTAYENDRQNRQTQTYDDLLRAMHEALYGSYGDVFAQELRKTFKAALIDEFQDTDPVQYDIFKKVFVEAPEIPVFFVGDPKQAIYAFRGGDIFTYLQAAKNVSQDATYYLDTNFRSTPRLMQAVNAIFKDTNGKFTFGNEYIKYSNEIKAITTDDQKVEALKISGQDDPKPFRFVEVTGNQDVRLNALVQNVVETLNEQHGNLTPKDIAILVNLKATGRTIMEKLRKCGVPCVLQNPGNVFSQTLSQYKKERKSSPSRMAAELFDVLKALAKKGGEKQLRTALSTSFFGLTPVELLNLTEEQKADWMVKFDDMNHRWQSRGFAAALAKLDEYSGGYREHIVRQENGVRLLVDCEQLLELSLAAVKEIGPSPEKLIAWLEERIVHRDDESDSDVFQRELENDSDAVHILTMHKSKGLQFPVVFLPDCSLYVKDHSLHPYHRDNQLFLSIRENEAWVKEAEE
ncbi:MAG: UvrD-helicase domain-containing protein, partial [Victivallales bacterium]|nr:UvrD-helicase domain-containing protein [Victivallales bacterium]